MTLYHTVMSLHQFNLIFRLIMSISLSEREVKEMPNMHMTFSESNPDDMVLYEALQSLGRKNRTILLKLLARKTIEQYGYLFKPEHAATLFEILERGSPILPMSPLSVASASYQYSSTVFPLKKKGKKRGPKPKNKKPAGQPAEKAAVTTSSAAKTEPQREVSANTNIPSDNADRDVNKEFYKKMGSFLEEEIYNT